MKKLILGMLVLVMAGCGGGGGSTSGNTTPANAVQNPSSTVQKTSIVDGEWDVTSSTAPYLNKSPSVYVTYDYMTIKFNNGEISISAQYFPLINTKSGTFSVTNGMLNYNLISESNITAHLSGSLGSPLDYLNKNINETATVNINILGNSMTWKDNTGSIVAVLTKK